MKTGFYTCNNCGFYDSERKYCMLKGHQASNKDWCSKHNSNVYTCDSCGRLLTTPIIWENGDNINIFCKNCFKSIIK